MLLVIGTSSGNLRRRVGPNAWVVLEELLLEAALGESEPRRATSHATVRALATRTGLSKDTVSRSLHKLRAAKVLAVEALRHDDTGRFVSVRYVIALDALPIVLRAATEPEPVNAATTRKPTAPQQLSMLS